jgi:hypothetical protein
VTCSILVALVLLAACSLRPLCAGQETLTPETLARLYARPTNFFAETVLLKPLEIEPARPFLTLAPLLLLQAMPPFPPNQFGMLSPSNGSLHLDTQRPTIYAALDTLELGPGKTRPRCTYLWCYPASEGAATLTRLRLQGVRITLDSQGRPAVWEVMADSSGARLLFVSESIESAAATRYGKVLPGRRYAIEQSLAERPNAVVARILDDGPVPMGPLVYLEAATGDVSTVLCRCMPAQARTVTQTRMCEVLPFAAHEDLLLQVLAQMKSKLAYWPREDSRALKLDAWLRLPDTW